MTEAHRARIVAIRATDDVSRRWRGVDLDAEFTEGLEDDELHQYVVEAPDGQVVGMIQFSEEDDADYRHASLDIFIDPVAQRRGFGSDAIRTLAGFLFDQRSHHRLVIDPAADNHAAVACYARVGFQPVGIMRSYERQGDGSWADGLLMDMLRSDRPPA